MNLLLLHIVSRRRLGIKFGVIALVMACRVLIENGRLDFRDSWHEDNPSYFLATGNAPSDNRTITTMHETTIQESSNDDWWLIPGKEGNKSLIHPHQGARHPNGTLGMKVNPSIERLEKIGVQQVVRERPVLCPNVLVANSSELMNDGSGQNSSIALPFLEQDRARPILEKVKTGLAQARQDLQEMRRRSARPIKILCMVYTVHDSSGHNVNLEAVAHTWAQQCDGFWAASNVTDHKIGAIDLRHRGPEIYKNMYQKIRSMWTYAYDHYLEDYDYFYICGDDTYVLMDNMRHFLMSDHVKRLEDGYLDIFSRYFVKRANETAQFRPRPLYFASPMMYPREKENFVAMMGGSGYILNQAAVKLWGEAGADTFLTDTKSSQEDLLFPNFFHTQNIFLSDCQDENGGFRFAEAASHVAIFNGWNSAIQPRRLRKTYGIPINVGKRYISKYLIAFHLKIEKQNLHDLGYSMADLIYRYHAFFEDFCSMPLTAATISDRRVFAHADI